MLSVTLSTRSQTKSGPAVKDAQTEQTQLRTSEIPAHEGQSPSAVSPVIPDSGKKETSSPWIEKYEIGSGKDRINVRIFREPVILDA